MTRFPDSAHLVWWAGLCPRNDESAGKRRSTRTRKSGTWLKTALVIAARAAVRTKDTYLHTQFIRIKARRDAKKKAIVAVAASMLPPRGTCFETVLNTRTSAPIILPSPTRMENTGVRRAGNAGMGSLVQSPSIDGTFRLYPAELKLRQTTIDNLKSLSLNRY